MKTALAIVIALCAVARADDAQCVERDCPSDSKHPGLRMSCDHPLCECYETCSGPAGNGAAGEAMVEGTAKGLAYLFMPVMIFAMPGHMLEMLGGSPLESSEHAHAERDAYVAKRLALEATGRAAEGKREALWAGYDSEPRDDLRDASASPIKTARKKRPLVQFPKPKLVIPDSILCEQAAFLVGHVHTNNPIGGFPSERDMMNRCGPFFVPGRATVACGPGTFACGLQPQVCCPNDFPVYNPCDQLCYRTTDFRAGGEASMHCDAKTCLTYP